MKGYGTETDIQGASIAAQIVANATAERSFTIGEDQILSSAWGVKDAVDRVVMSGFPEDIRRNCDFLARVYLGLRGFSVSVGVPQMLSGQHVESPIRIYVQDIINPVMDEVQNMIISSLDSEFGNSISYNPDIEEKRLRYPWKLVIYHKDKRTRSYLRLVSSN